MTATTAKLTLDVGDVIAIPEDSYCYGVGVLLLRITVIDTKGLPITDLEWLWLKGRQLRDDGSEVKTRVVLVAVKALAAAIREGRRLFPPDPSPAETRG